MFELISNLCETHKNKIIFRDCVSQVTGEYHNVLYPLTSSICIVINAELMPTCKYVSQFNMDIKPNVFMLRISDKSM